MIRISISLVDKQCENNDKGHDILPCTKIDAYRPLLHNLEQISEKSCSKKDKEKFFYINKYIIFYQLNFEI